MKKCKYINNFKILNNIKELKIIFEIKNNFYLNNKLFSIAGRIIRKRHMGKATFIIIKDKTSKIQIYLSDNITKNYNKIIENTVIGDIIGINGTLFKTKSNEITLKAKTIKILSKTLKCFPDKISGIIDKEICYRKRHLDLICNKKTLKKFLLRSKIIYEIRKFFIKKKFIEVETPMMQNIIGGADAEPFKTYHKSLNKELYFRISPELYLKKLVVGGINKVFEIGKNFRNEGLSIKHHPEFTMIEFYEAYSNYKNLIIITEELFKHLSKKFLKKSIKYKKKTIDFKEPFEKINFYEAIFKYCKDINDKNINNYTYLKNFLIKNNINMEENASITDIQCKIFDNLVEKNLIKPTFIMHHHVNISPLAKKIDNENNLTERFELYICGKEIANGFSELNNPEEQNERFLEQLKKDKQKTIDLEYIDALKYGLPPTAGEGIGIDRLIMIFTKSKSIKDVILFPFMKDKQI